MLRAVSAALAATLVGLLAVSPATSASQPPAQSWRPYYGDYSTRSALDTLSVRREGEIATAQEIVVGINGPLHGSQGEFDYVIVDVAYDCAAVTSRSIHARFFRREGSMIWEEELGTAPRSLANSSPFNHFRAWLCGEQVGQPDPGGLPDVATFLNEAVRWMRAAPEVPAAPQ